ncbi:MAG: DNA recombination protein RmuC, partial [Clostridia bacterium]|nr:DNA recombination protein RmuC [Clostridia bacterium]
RISKKYIAPPYTTDFAIMFLPTEGLYAEALRTRGLMEELQQSQRVMIAGPSTLTAMLSSLQLGFRTLAIEQRSAEVWQLLGAVKNDFTTFGQLLEKTQKKLQEAATSIETASKRSNAITRKLQDVEVLVPSDTQPLLFEENEPEN